MAWRAANVKAKFSELLDTAASEGPQLILHRKDVFVAMTEVELKTACGSTRRATNKVHQRVGRHENATRRPAYRGRVRRVKLSLEAPLIYLLDTNVVSQQMAPRQHLAARHLMEQNEHIDYIDYAD